MDDDAAEKLSALARRMHVNEGTLARSLLTTALDEADPDPANIVALLDGIADAWEDAHVGWRQAQDGALLGPWRWMLLVYRIDPERDRIVVVTIQDARSSPSHVTQPLMWSRRRENSPGIWHRCQSVARGAL